MKAYSDHSRIVDGHRARGDSAAAYRVPSSILLKGFLAAVCVVSGLLAAGAAADTTYSIFLVRHAEKAAPVDSADGPGLTGCGEKRAVALATFLEDVPVQAVFSSPYRRTRETAAPLARRKGLPVQEYNPRDLERMARSLKNARRDVLVVGHSTTTPVLAGLLLGETWPVLDESEYDFIYQFVASDQGAKVYRYRQNFRCAD